MLTPGECKRAKSHLNNLWRSMQNRISIANRNAVPIAANNLPAPSSHTDRSNGNDNIGQSQVDELENLLKTKDSSRRVALTQRNETIDKVLDSFWKEPRIDKDNNVLIYWESKKAVQPILFALSNIVLSVPATQVSVERLFSSLKFVLSPQRAQMSEPLLNSLLLVRSNKLFNVI